jgi:phage gp46-like protein
MKDIGLFIQSDGGSIDLGIQGADLATDSGLQTAVMVSLFTDAQAEEEELPYVGASRRGWWGNLFPEVDRDEVGSKLWILAREKRTQETLNRAEEYAGAALSWMLEDGVAESVDVETSFDTNGALIIQALITKPGGDQKRFRFNQAWQAEEET